MTITEFVCLLLGDSAALTYLVVSAILILVLASAWFIIYVVPRWTARNYWTTYLALTGHYPNCNQCRIARKCPLR